MQSKSVTAAASDCVCVTLFRLRVSLGNSRMAKHTLSRMDRNQVYRPRRCVCEHAARSTLALRATSHLKRVRSLAQNRHCYDTLETTEKVKECRPLFASQFSHLNTLIGIYKTQAEFLIQILCLHFH